MRFKRLAHELLFDDFGAAVVIYRLKRCHVTRMWLGALPTSAFSTCNRRVGNEKHFYAGLMHVSPTTLEKDKDLYNPAYKESSVGTIPVRFVRSTRSLGNRMSTISVSYRCADGVMIRQEIVREMLDSAHMVFKRASPEEVGKVDAIRDSAKLPRTGLVNCFMLRRE